MADGILQNLEASASLLPGDKWLSRVKRLRAIKSELAQIIHDEGGTIHGGFLDVAVEDIDVAAGFVGTAIDAIDCVITTENSEVAP